MREFRTHIQRAVDHFGSQKKLAEAMGCSQQQISYLLHCADRVSAEMAIGLDAATGGAVSRHDLRPDIYGPHPERASA